MNISAAFLLWGQRRIERGAWFLAPLSWAWGLVSWCKNFFYDRGWLPVIRVNRPVVSVGNLVAGGAGKTPLALLLASQFSHRNVAILTRGYGAIPDEAFLLQRRLPQARVYVGKHRAKLAQRAIREGAQLLILDDGFQYRKLHRNFDLVILSGSDPFGKGHFIPWGFLRDSPKRLRQAHHIFVARSPHAASVAKRRWLSPPGAPTPWIALQVVVDRILDLSENPIASLHGKKVAVFSGIAKPAAFKNTVQTLGARVVAEWILADHGYASPRALRRFASQAKTQGATALICTEKDFVKLDPHLRLPLPLLFLEISFRIAEECEQWENLIAKIDCTIDTIPITH